MGLSCGQREGAACGLALLAKVQGWEEEGGPPGWPPPAVFVGISAPPWEAGILVSRTTSDAEGIEEQVFSGTKPCKWINRCWLLPDRGVLYVDIVFPSSAFNPMLILPPHLPQLELMLNSPHMYDYFETFPSVRSFSLSSLARAMVCGTMRYIREEISAFLPLS